MQQLVKYLENFKKSFTKFIKQYDILNIKE